jgi:hypothetical protein
MRNAVNAFTQGCAVAALLASFPVTAPAEGEDRWVPSLAITSGATFQNQDGLADSVLFQDMNPVPVPLGGPQSGDDLVVSPFVGAALELMTPALAIPTRPRLFAGGEILPTFGSRRTVAVQGDPGCIRGAEPDAPCARDELPGQRVNPFGANAANGTGTELTSEIDLLTYGASMGVALPLRLGERQLRIKPSFGWISYEIEAEGLVSEADCRVQPPGGALTQCTDVYSTTFMPGDPPLSTGFLREMTLTATGSRRFHGIGPGLDVEVETGRFGPLGTSLFLGARAYHVLGDRTIAFDTSQAFADELGMDVATARFEVEVEPWLYRAHVGIRLHWLGSRQ